ncbi:MAG TPA: selenoneine biosynthesis selenosugar synthase SenB [candidate division Zixibacteria bacterium]|nr:selenoneine biosynthesis selenosugar synthase SenB [candidate division Zixibacteria bacterium]
MKIHLVTPAPLAFNNGNKITAVRWNAIFRKLGHRVTLGRSFDGRPCDLLVALHARRSYESIARFHECHPDRPLIVALTGTDLYRDIRVDRRAQRSLEIATRIVALQRMALAELPPYLHGKTRIIYQSARPMRSRVPPWTSERFKVCVVGHLRKEKDPLRAALAARRLPPDSRVVIAHVGRALDGSLQRRARSESANNPRYRWLGELPHWKTRRLLAQSHVTVISSLMEGSSNVLSEALAASVPVVAARIPGLIGTLGSDYPGFFPPGDTSALAGVLRRLESERKFYLRLRRACARAARLVRPARELRAWKSLLNELT